MPVKLYDYQLESIKSLRTGSILCGGVGSGKSITSLAYYYVKECGGQIGDILKPMQTPKPLYIITTARKRDTKEWDNECTPFLLEATIDSWNNIGKYVEVKNSFFIFDEQRLVGSGAWVKAFIKIAKYNNWILLSATPGDTWMDYVPVFIANGYFKNRTEFTREHVVYSRFAKFPKIDRYVNTGKLIKLRREVLVDMDYKKHTVPHHETIHVDYDKDGYLEVSKNRWNPYTNEPIANVSELCYTLRRVINSDETRQEAVYQLTREHPRSIIFYNYNYELDILRNIAYGDDYTVAEWNGHKHEPVPDTKKWVYLVQYTAGAEGWNCITTDTIIFYSQNYSYKIMIQSAGRIDRLSSPFKDLFFYHLKSKSPLDKAISGALSRKKKFNEKKFFEKSVKK